MTTPSTALILWGDVYLDRVNEIQKLPPRARDGDASMSTALPGVAPEHGKSYAWDSEDEKSEYGRVIRKPFLYDY